MSMTRVGCMRFSVKILLSLVGWDPGLVLSRKKRKKRTMEINIDAVGKKNPAHCPSQPFEATPTKQFPLTFSGIPRFSQ